MKIRKISITDFKGIVDTLELDFTGPDGKPLDLVVLAGPNGCGKTSVLEACISAIGPNDKILGKKSYGPNIVREGKDNAVIRTEFQIGDDVVEKECSYHKNAEIPLDNIAWIHRNFSPKHSEEVINTPMLFFSSWRGPKLPGGVVLYADGNVQRIPKTEENRLFHIINEVVRIRARRSFEQNDTIKPDKADEIMQKINRAWSFFYPDRKNDFFEPKPYGEDKFNIFLNKPDFNEIIPIDVLSSGELEIFILLGWLAINDLSGGIVFIDEPELHLHPAWHRIIIPALRTALPDTQFIVATHSPQVLSSCQPSSIRLLFNEDHYRTGLSHKERKAQSPPESYGIDSNRILEEIMDVSKRPEEVQNKFDSLFEAIGRNQLDNAKIILNELYVLIINDPELLKAETLIKRKELIGK